MSAPRELLSLRGVSKSYATRVLTGVDFDLAPGEVHALVGENGAGKSTMARIIAGLTQPDEGTLQLRDAPYAPRNKPEAEHAGVRLVMQELNLVGNLTVAENLFFDQMPRRFGWIDYRTMNARARDIMRETGLDDFDPEAPVKSLGVGQQQLVEIAAGLSRNCQVLILDEPTAALTLPEIERLFRQIAKLKATGAGVIYISHRLEEIRQIADRITVLRDGKIIATRPAASLGTEEMVRLMVGRDLEGGLERVAASGSEVVLRVENLRVGTSVRGISFDLHRGEILGFAGLMGAGRTETMRAVFAADRRDAGEIFLHGASRPARIRSPRDAVGQGIALLTEDRKTQGLLLPLSIGQNITLPNLQQLSGTAGWLEPERERGAGAQWIDRLGVRCRGAEQPVHELSGGNQQKVIIAKWLFRDCDILIFDEPTRGIDVGAKFEIYKLLGKLAEQGKAIIVVSSDLKELLAVCDRLLVMSAGRITASFRRGEWTEEKIMAAAFSGLTGANRPNAPEQTGRH